MFAKACELGLEGIVSKRAGSRRRLCKPDSVHWVDGLVEECDRLCARMVECGTFTRLNPEKHPNSVIAGTATERSPNVVAWIR